LREKEKPYAYQKQQLILLCCMRACCKNAERHADSALRGGAATEDGQNIYRKIKPGKWKALFFSYPIREGGKTKKKEKQF
jgi:hypothetical protein